MKTQESMFFWQLCARLYGRSVKRVSGAAYGRMCELIRPKLGEEMVVLELACGTGQLSYPLSGSVQLWEATDGSEAMIRAARRTKNSGSLRFAVQDAASLPYEHDTFDAVVIANALHLMQRPELVLREIRRVLKPGGMLFAPTYVHGGARRPGLRLRLMQVLGLRIRHRWTAGQLKEVLADVGFEPETVTVLPDRLAPLCYIDARNGK